MDFVKSPMNYTGGKFKLLSQILPLFPKDIGTFVDLFTGGGNVAVNVDADRIIANDFSSEVINIYKMFQGFENVDDLISDINDVINKYDLSKTNSEGFLKLRNDYNATHNNDKFKSILLYVLICYSFNNQIRFNSKGEYNMPFGKDRSMFTDRMKGNLINFHKAITEKNIIFTNYDFKEIKIDKLSYNDFIYCDPPYLITCASYNERDGWNENEEKSLLSILDRLNDNHIKFALSNVLESKGKANDILIEWSEKYNVNHLDYTYSNCNYHTKDKVSKSDEVLITNY